MTWTPEHEKARPWVEISREVIEIPCDCPALCGWKHFRKAD